MRIRRSFFTSESDARVGGMINGLRKEGSILNGNDPLGLLRGVPEPEKLTVGGEPVIFQERKIWVRVDRLK
jgi:hypothetical protein